MSKTFYRRRSEIWCLQGTCPTLFATGSRRVGPVADHGCHDEERGLPPYHRSLMVALLGELAGIPCRGCFRQRARLGSADEALAKDLRRRISRNARIRSGDRGGGADACHRPIPSRSSLESNRSAAHHGRMPQPVNAPSTRAQERSRLVCSRSGEKWRPGPLVDWLSPHPAAANSRFDKTWGQAQPDHNPALSPVHTDLMLRKQQIAEHGVAAAISDRASLPLYVLGASTIKRHRPHTPLRRLS